MLTENIRHATLFRDDDVYIYIETISFVYADDMYIYIYVI